MQPILLYFAAAHFPLRVWDLAESEITNPMDLRVFMEAQGESSSSTSLTALAAIRHSGLVNQGTSYCTLEEPGAIEYFQENGTRDFLIWWNANEYKVLDAERIRIAELRHRIADNPEELSVYNARIQELERWLGVFSEWFVFNGFPPPNVSRPMVQEQSPSGAKSKEEPDNLTNQKPDVLFKAYSEEYLKYVGGNFSAKTLENASRVMKAFCEMYGERILTSFTLEDLEKFKTKRKEQEAKNTTINIDIRTIKAAFQVAVEWKRITENPFENAKQLKVDQKIKKILSPDEFKKIIDAIKEKWLRDIVSFNVLTGLRLGEIMNLRWSAYDAAKKQIRVQSDDEYRVKGGKMRDIPLGADAVSLLEGRDHKGEYIFLGEGGKKYTNDYVSRRFKAYVREAGLPEEIHFHRLRDTYCTWLADKNVPIHVIKALAGHSSVRVTEGYLSTNTEAMKGEVEKIKLPGKTSSGENEKP